MAVGGNLADGRGRDSLLCVGGGEGGRVGKIWDGGKGREMVGGWWVEMKEAKRLVMAIPNV